MSGPLVSCVVPVYNGDRYLAEALDSILGQTYSPIELIVADDGSTDGTVAIVSGYRDRVRLVCQPNTGHSAARNLGLGASRGELVAFLDCDDLWHPEKLERQVARFQARPGLEVCITFMQNFLSPDIAPVGPSGLDPAALDPVPGYKSHTLLARRSVFERVGAFNPELRHGSDADWFMRAIEAGVEVDVVHDVLVRRRLHDANRSTRLADNSRREHVRIVKASLDRRRAAG